MSNQQDDAIHLGIDENKILDKKIIKSGEQVIKINNNDQKSILKNWLNQDFDIHLSAIIAQDEESHMDLYYYFMERTSYEKVILQVELPREEPKTVTINDLINSVFYEAEATEMFGIQFEGNDITEVFLPENWDKGFPMRKDWVNPKEEDD